MTSKKESQGKPDTVLWISCENPAWGNVELCLCENVHLKKM